MIENGTYLILRQNGSAFSVIRAKGGNYRKYEIINYNEFGPLNVAPRAILLISHQRVIPELANCFSVIEKTILSVAYLCTENVHFGLSKLSLNVIISGAFNADIYI